MEIFLDSHLFVMLAGMLLLTLPTDVEIQNSESWI
jgi:hypothetical protein